MQLSYYHATAIPVRIMSAAPKQEMSSQPEARGRADQERSNDAERIKARACSLARAQLRAHEDLDTKSLKILVLHPPPQGLDIGSEEEILERWYSMIPPALQNNAFVTAFRLFVLPFSPGTPVIPVKQERSARC